MPSCARFDVGFIIFNSTDHPEAVKTIILGVSFLAAGHRLHTKKAPKHEKSNPKFHGAVVRPRSRHRARTRPPIKYYVRGSRALLRRSSFDKVSPKNPLLKEVIIMPSTITLNEFRSVERPRAGCVPG